MRRPDSLCSAGRDAKAKASKPSMPKNNTSIFKLIPEIVEKEEKYLFIYLFILLRLGVTYIKNIEDNYKTRQGHHNSKNQLLCAQIN